MAYLYELEHSRFRLMPALRTERSESPSHSGLDRSRVFPEHREGAVRNAGILLGLAGIAILPLMIPLGLALIVSGMECIWLASPGPV
jgi:hypothetical protein